MFKLTYLILIGLMLTACSSLEYKSSQLEVGASRTDVVKVMGTAPYKFTEENVDVRRYAVVAGFGYCDYREFYIYRDVLIYKNEYHRASIAGCTVGLKKIDWGPVLNAAEKFDKVHPKTPTKKVDNNIIQNLKDLQVMKNNGSLTDAEYIKAKELLLNK